MAVRLIGAIPASFAAQQRTTGRACKACGRGLVSGSAAQRKVRQTQQAGTANDGEQHTGEHANPSRTTRASPLRRTIHLGGYPFGTAAVGRSEVAVQPSAIPLTCRVGIGVSVLDLHPNILSVRWACVHPPNSRLPVASCKADRPATSRWPADSQPSGQSRVPATRSGVARSRAPAPGHFSRSSTAKTRSMRQRAVGRRRKCRGQRAGT